MVLNLEDIDKLFLWARIMGLVSKGRLDQRDRIPRTDLSGNSEVFVGEIPE